MTGEADPASSFLASPRRRRRLAAAAVVAVLGGGVALLAIFYANTAHPLQSKITNEPPQLVEPTPNTVRLASRDREEARKVAEQFIYTAVIRRHTGDSWGLTAAAMRQGFTRASWSKGAIPVVPYPAEALAIVKYRVDYSFKDRLGLKVALVPKPTSNVDGMAASIELQKVGDPARSRWVVDYWASSGMGVSKAALGKGPSGPTEDLKPRLGAAWLLLPVLLMGTLLLSVPLFLGGRGWYRSSRATRRYAAEMAASQRAIDNPS